MVCDNPVDRCGGDQDFFASADTEGALGVVNHVDAGTFEVVPERIRNVCRVAIPGLTGRSGQGERLSMSMTSELSTSSIARAE